MSMVASMTAQRLNRDQFFDKLAGMDQANLKKLLWTLYWRGAAPVRERIEDLMQPQGAESRARVGRTAPDAEAIMAEIIEFAALARAGSYLAGDRRVSRQERSRWRHTFRRLAQDAQNALPGEDVETAVAAITEMIDLACDTRRHDYFHSDDPMEAARFVVSDAVVAMWSRLRDAYGANHMVASAAADLVRWESRYGWTRRGYGWVSEREISLASALCGLVVTPDLWTAVAGHYLDALDRVAKDGSDRWGSGRAREQRAEDLSEWNAVLVERLVGSDHEGLLDRMVTHPALAGPELTFVQARLARERGDREAAGALVRRCLKSLPGHPGFRRFAEEVDELR
jgi:hypothetical protein